MDISAHNLSEASAKGTSSERRLVFRIHPKLREDCSPAILPFSSTTTGTLRSASVKAAVNPTMPPPMMTTVVACGKLVAGLIIGFMIGAIGTVLLMAYYWPILMVTVSALEAPLNAVTSISTL